MTRLALAALVAAAAFAAPSPANAVLLCSHVKTTGTVLGDRTLARHCFGWVATARYICTDSTPGVAEAGLDVRLCLPAV
ncbi:MAG TPA: hypothetical protein VGX28_05000 [Frankiaceae bacterium]|jgi:hypothetical protein|nr:hypothetical protein [Frankiaceae bacterium]